MICLVQTPATGAELEDLVKRQLQKCALKSSKICVVMAATGYNPVYASACMGAALELSAETYHRVLPSARAAAGKSFAEAWTAGHFVE